MAFAELLEGDVVMLVKARREDLKGGYGQCEQSCILSSRGSEALTALKSGDPVKGDVVQKLLHDALIMSAMGDVTDYLGDVSGVKSWARMIARIPSVLRRRRCPL